MKSIESVPDYTVESEFPFLHLVTQTGILFSGRAGGTTVRGPFHKGHRTIRSIHFAVPRSLPSSFSRGISTLILNHIYFQRQEDMTSLVSELPDLVDFRCLEVTFGSYPTEPPRKRPRKSRSNLKDVNFFAHSPPAKGNKELRDRFYLLALNPFLAVYDSASFFNDGEVAVIRALLPLKKLVLFGLHGHYEYDPDSKSYLFEQGRWSNYMDFAVRARPDSTVIYCCANQLNTNMVGWSQVAATCSGLSRPPQFVIGAISRNDLLAFNANLVKKMPLLFRPGAVRYSLMLDNKGWLLASLDSDQLRGEGKEKLTDVYP